MYHLYQVQIIQIVEINGKVGQGLLRFDLI
jgi:hypothetical protein